MGTSIPDKTQENILLTEVECRYGQGWRFTVLKRDTKQFLFSDTFKRRPAGMKTLAKHILDGYGVALMTGKVSGVVVVDVDLYKGAKIPAGTPLTATVRTPRGGVHVYFALPEGMEVPTLSAEQSRWGVEVKSDKHAVIYPGSRLAGGGTYRWAKGLSPGDMSLAPFPEWLAERKEAVEPYTKAAERVQAADERNAVLNLEVWKLRQRFGENLDEERLDIVRCAALDAGLAPTEVQCTIDSALQAPLVRHTGKGPIRKAFDLPTQIRSGRYHDAHGEGAPAPPAQRLGPANGMDPLEGLLLSLDPRPWGQRKLPRGGDEALLRTGRCAVGVQEPWRAHRSLPERRLAGLETHWRGGAEGS